MKNILYIFATVLLMGWTTMRFGYELSPTTTVDGIGIMGLLFLLARICPTWRWFAGSVGGCLLLSAMGTFILDISAYWFWISIIGSVIMFIVMSLTPKDAYIFRVERETT